MEELEQQSTSLEPRPHLLPGTRLGDRYELIRPVAAGGFGAVYLAEHVHTGRRVALKVLHAWLAHDDDTRERFRRELSAPAAIDHPGIVDVIDADVDPTGTPFLVMEWLEGQTLRQRMKEGRCSLTELRDLFAPLLGALEAAHDAGFVHRDLKPENVIIARGPDGVERPRIVDFGLARQTGARTVTVTGTSLGTPRYMSPEQFMDSKAVGPTADVWSVGVMMYEALTGSSPFEAESPHQLMLKILVEPHVPVSARLPACPSRLASMIDGCLEKEPGGRPSNARALRFLFLGAYAAISGGVDLRTIPEMSVAKTAEMAPSVPDQATANQRPGGRGPEAMPRAEHPPPPPSPFARATPEPSPLPAAPPTPAPWAPPTPVVPRTQPLPPSHSPEPRRVPTIFIVGPIVGLLGVLVALGIGAWMILERSEAEAVDRPQRPVAAPVAPPPSPMTPNPPPVPTPGSPAQPGPSPEPSGRTGAAAEPGPLHPITGPIDRVLFE